ncbi:MAG: cytochrome c oxidase assembly protein [Burkholderiales bacterium]
MSENKRLLRKLLVISVAMFGFGFALVPLYEKICQVTGIRSLLRPDHVPSANTQIDRSRQVAIELDTNIHKLPWTFKPLSSHVDVHPGELTRVQYEVTNNQDRAVTGQAIPSYGPQLAAQFFKKVECFCFDKHTLGAGEVRQMEVVFVIDPALPKVINTITLSFTFFEVEGGGAQGAGS